MNITDLLILSVVIGLINGFKEMKFKAKSFFKSSLTFFTTGLIFIITGNLFLNDLLDKYLPSEEYGIWLFGGLLLLYPMYLTIKGLKKKTTNSLR
ncbi:UNVERIFIED_ORG: putative Mn2+ efflux pump MntP [Peribacillus simplex]